MAKSRKSKEYIIQRPTELMVEPLLTIGASQTFKDCEWCYQFDGDEPYVFAATKPSYAGDNAKLSFTLTNQTNTNIVFKDSKTGKEFKLFVREKI